MLIKKILLLKKNQENVEAKGWVTTSRGNKNIIFISLNDGSSFNNLQIVIKKINEFDKAEKLKIGSVLIVEGDIKMTPTAQQPMELVAKKIIFTDISNETYPLQKKNISLEKLRMMPHLRHRTNLFRAITRVRSTICHAIHEYFKQNDFIYIAAPIITSNDGEGAGDSFYVKTKNKSEFFGSEVTLGVTGQLHAEALALGMGKVYTFAPTFRAENSHTKRHAAEFWMIEPEVAFYDMHQIIEVAYESMLFVIKEVLKNNKDEIDYLSKYNNKDLVGNLNNLLKSKLQKLDYSDAIKILQNTLEKRGSNFFENNKIEFGIDLATEHEKYLTDVYFKNPVVIINYTIAIKAFYMYQNKDGNTVAAFDLLVPGVGEMIGGSQREGDLNKLIARMKEIGLNINEYEWYLNLRKFGYSGSSGYGLGLERMIMYITGIDNIRDVLPFPRTPNSIFA